jgi:hypothetical protein
MHTDESANVPGGQRRQRSGAVIGSKRLHDTGEEEEGAPNEIHAY